MAVLLEMLGTLAATCRAIATGRGRVRNWRWQGGWGLPLFGHSGAKYRQQNYRVPVEKNTCPLRLLTENFTSLRGRAWLEPRDSGSSSWLPKTGLSRAHEVWMIENRRFVRSVVVKPIEFSLGFNVVAIELIIRCSSAGRLSGSEISQSMNAELESGAQ
jgi:hypothetical protein